ncbi:MAG: response regulator [Elusimicrobiota bacterium]
MNTHPVRHCSNGLIKEAFITYKITIIEDEQAEQKTLRFILEKERYITAAYTSGYKAIEAIKKDPPDLVILDLKLPDIDGIEVCKILKKDKELKDIPVIMVSGRSMDEQAGLKSGAEYYLSKPYMPDELINTIKAILNPE